jgi:hypothetical protein
VVAGMILISRMHLDWLKFFNQAELRALLDWKRAFEEFEA